MWRWSLARKTSSTLSLRYVDEPVRHKILDLVGDLALLGRPIKGLILAIRAGHTANAAFVRKLKDYPRLRALAGIAEEPVFDWRPSASCCPTAIHSCWWTRLSIWRGGRRSLDTRM